MSKYSDLPLYKTTYDLMICVYQYTSNFSREHKHTIGEKLKDEIFELFLLLYRANKADEKAPIVEEAREKVERVRLLVRLTKDLHILNMGRFVKLNQSIEEVSKQLFGWQRSFT